MNDKTPAQVNAPLSAIIPDVYIYIGGVLIIVLIIAVIYLIWHHNREVKGIIDDYESEIRKLQARMRKLQEGSKITVRNQLANQHRSDVKTTEEKANLSVQQDIEDDIALQKQSAEIEDVKEEASQIHYTYITPSSKERFVESSRGPEKSFFRMWKDGNIFKYEFSGNVDKALANLNAVFDDTCYLQGSQMNAKSIENVSSGELDKQLNIIKKAVIKLVE